MTVKVYTVPNCSHCIQVKNYLQHHHVKFDEIAVTAGSKEAREMIKKSGQLSVPVTDYHGDVVVRFEKDKLAALVKKYHGK
ncbi:MAG: NrdH-redoxin [Bacteroidetes bacterium]|nr:NrdH-redoxin [Bacteroidota bacterium]